MKSELVLELTNTFESHAQQTDNGIEYWLARDLQVLLGYEKWSNFLNVVTKAKTACEVAGNHAADHFADVNKMVDLGSGSQREIEDLMLSRYACYLIAPRGFARCGGCKEGGATTGCRRGEVAQENRRFRNLKQNH